MGEYSWSSLRLSVERMIAGARRTKLHRTPSTESLVSTRSNFGVVRDLSRPHGNRAEGEPERRAAGLSRELVSCVRGHRKCIVIGVNSPGERWSLLATRLLAPNAGAMTLEGTNTYVVKNPDARRVVVVDPGPDDRGHILKIMSLGEVELILLTHGHEDHAETAAALAEKTGAPVRSFDQSLCVDGEALKDGEEFAAGGTRLRVIATPGHTADSACFHLVDDGGLDGSRPAGSMLTGDTILGRGTSVIAPPDGALAPYLDSLRRLIEVGPAMVLPGHGPALQDLRVVALDYISHRRARLREVDAAYSQLATSSPYGDVTAEAVTDLVYADVSPHVRRAAEMSVAAQLTYLAEGRDNRSHPSHSMKASRQW